MENMDWKTSQPGVILKTFELLTMEIFQMKDINSSVFSYLDSRLGLVHYYIKSAYIHETYSLRPKKRNPSYSQMMAAASGVEQTFCQFLQLEHNLNRVKTIVLQTWKIHRECRGDWKAAVESFLDNKGESLHSLQNAVRDCQYKYNQIWPINDSNTVRLDCLKRLVQLLEIRYQLERRKRK